MMAGQHNTRERKPVVWQTSGVIMTSHVFSVNVFLPAVKQLALSQSGVTFACGLRRDKFLLKNTHTAGKLTGC